MDKIKEWVNKNKIIAVALGAIVVLIFLKGLGVDL